MGKIGILMHVKDLVLEEKVKDFGLERRDNAHLHITSYVFEAKEEVLDEVVRLVKEISKSYLSIKVRVSEISVSDYGSARFLVDDNVSLLNFHREIVSKLVKFRDLEAPSKAKKFYDEFSDEEKKLIDKYGRANVLHRYKPHISIGKWGGEKMRKGFHRDIEIREAGVYFDKGDGAGWELRSVS
jgi:hypothetical protein